jgi:hypothetical protein
LLEAQLASPKVVDGFTKLFNPTQLKDVASKKKRADVIRAEALMTDVRLLMQNLKVPSLVSVQTTGRFDVRLAAFLMGKGKELEGQSWKFIDDILQAPWLAKTIHRRQVVGLCRYALTKTKMPVRQLQLRCGDNCSYTCRLSSVCVALLMAQSGRAGYMVCHVWCVS